MYKFRSIIHEYIPQSLALIALLWLALLHGGMSHADTTAMKQDVIVDARWLQQRLADDNMRIIDARAADKYLAGHIPGAVNLPVEKTFRQGNAKSKVADIHTIQQLFREAGIRRDHTVVVYDNDEHISAGRAFWVLEVFGITDVKLLNGGYKNWRAQGFPVSTTPPTVSPSDYVVTVNPRYLATKLDVELAINDNSKQLVDARTQAEYRGESSRASRFGHIPGAINIPVRKVLQSGKHSRLIKPLSELRNIYQGIDQSKIVYLYCNRGEHASLSYAVLRHLGYQVAHYDGSWLEWGNDPAMPIETGKQPAP